MEAFESLAAKYEQSIRIESEVATEEESKRSGYPIGTKYSYIPQPETPVKAFERLKKLYAQEWCESLQRTFYLTYPITTQEVLKSELKDIDEFIAEANSLSVKKAFSIAPANGPNINWLDIKNDKHLEYLRLANGFYIANECGSSFNSTDSQVYGRYFLFRQWLIDQLETPPYSLEGKKYLEDEDIMLDRKFSYVTTRLDKKAEDEHIKDMAEDAKRPLSQRKYFHPNVGAAFSFLGHLNEEIQDYLDFPETGIFLFWLKATTSIYSEKSEKVDLLERVKNKVEAVFSLKNKTFNPIDIHDCELLRKLTKEIDQLISDLSVSPLQETILVNDKKKNERSEDTKRKARQAVTKFEEIIENIVKRERGKRIPLSNDQVVREAILSYITNSSGINLATTEKGLNRYLKDLGKEQTALKYGRQLVGQHRKRN